MSRYLIATSTLAALLLSGCMVGPKYTKPNVPLAPNYKESTAATSNFKEDADWHPAQPADTVLRGDWWTIFNDPQLNQLEPKVAAENQSLKAAEARFRQARALIQYNRSNLYPTIGTSPSAVGERESANRPYFTTTSNSTADTQIPLDLNYEIDLWGRIRHGVNAAREEAQASSADMQTALLSLQAELAMDYFEARSADAEEKLLNDTVKDYEDAYRITNNRFEGGVAPQSDVDQARTQLEAARVEASDVTLLRAQYEHAIAVLIGQPPATFMLAATPLDARPPAIPIGLPSELLERRPDIAAAERRVAEANDRIGIARAAYFPTLSLNGAVGYESTALSNLLSRSSFLWAVGPTLSETFFDAGRRRSASQQALAGYDETVANYRQTSLTAFQQVEDNLTALRVLNAEAAHQHQATQSAQSAQQIFNNRYVGGIDTYLQVVTAQTTALINERNDIDIMRRQMDASVLLIKALGGGWNTTNLPKL
ncbi:MULTISPECIES: efflux transporter outer membrane subunit [Acidobacteriaceae]|uniref:efflux transporter outer membrane subunit n=1 Tax=Acidobacteriaceae TaxID=204434 RepID=UPI00131E073D|nr:MULTISPECIES: efflux transporter outer membrane subunit [Acidobacteriaceae]MDW5265853.1 efflux transporter outer membrane subunit [Edaphobacter sp.]